jgi:chitinase
MLAFRWTQIAGPPITLSDPTAVQPTFVAPAIRGEREKLVFQLTVTDTDGLVDKGSVAVTIAGMRLDSVP